MVAYMFVLLLWACFQNVGNIGYFWEMPHGTAYSASPLEHIKHNPVLDGSPIFWGNAVLQCLQI